MSNEASKQWRVRDASGTVHVAPKPPQAFGYKTEPLWCVDDEANQYCAVGLTPRGSVSDWADHIVKDWREIAEPGQLFAHEQVAAETERFTGLMRWWCNYSGEAAGHLSGTRSVEQFAFHRGLLHLLEVAAKGEHAPTTDPLEEARKACGAIRSGEEPPR